MRATFLLWMLCLFSFACHKAEQTSGGPVHSKDTSQATSSSPTTLTLLTYNVLADPRKASQRIPKLLEILGKSKADIIALQEVSPWFLKSLNKQSWVKPYYRVGSNKGKVAPGGLYLLSKLPVKEYHYERLPSKQGRGFLMAKYRWHGRSFAVGTVHLESPLKAGALRAKQMKAAFSRLGRAEGSVLLGDYNFGDGEQPETATLPNHYIDPWPMIYPNQYGYTWNREVSEMAKKGSYPGEKSRRIDRILLRSEYWRPESIEILGNRPVVPGQKSLFPSDHFGLLGRFRYTKSPQGAAPGGRPETE